MSESDSVRDPVEILAESFVERLRRGESPSVTEYVARLPEHAEEIRDLFPALIEMESAKRSHPALEAQPTTRADTPERLGDYRVLRLLGAGGMGVVYEAERESLRARVALKVLHPRFRIDPTYLARFRNEARSAAQLHHTNIVTVFDYGEQDGVFYYAMQYIPGQGLDKVLDDARRLRQPRASNGKSSLLTNNKRVDPSVASITEALLSGRFAEETPALPGPEHTTAEVTPIADPSATSSSGIRMDSSGSFGELSDRSRYYREIARIGLQLADALAYAHARGVIHRDIKPANLILDGRGNVWVTDFGLAKFADQDLSNSQDIVGTLRYMSPERFKGVTSPAVDIYALGATLYELLTLRPVFESADKLRLINAISHRDPIRPKEIERQLPLDLETLVLKALAKDPRQRFASAEELREELRRFLENRPIRSRPTPLHERYWRWCKRNPMLAASNLTAALLALIITIGSVMVASRSYAHSQALLVEKGKTDLEAKKAKAAEGQAHQETFTALISQARAGRFSRRVGQRFVSLEAISKANQLLQNLGLPSEERDRRILELRNLAISCLALPDIRTIATVPNQSDHSYAVDDEGTILADVNPKGEIIVRRLLDGSEVDRLAGRGRPRSEPRFSPTGRYLLIEEETSDSTRKLLGWRLGDPAPPFEVAGSRRKLFPSFSPDENSLALISASGMGPEGWLEIRVFPSGRVQHRVRLDDTRCDQYSLTDLQFSPDGRLLAVCTGQDPRRKYGVLVLDVESGREVARRPPVEAIFSLAWHPDGSILAIGPTILRKILLWDFRADRIVHEIRQQREQAMMVAFNRTSEILTSTGVWGNGKLSLFHPRTGNELFQCQTYAAFRQTGRNGRLVSALARGSNVDVQEIVPGREYRTLTRGPVADGKSFSSVSVHPGGRLLAGGNEDGVVLWDLATGDELGFLKLGASDVWFEPESGALWTSSDLAGVERRSMAAIAEGYKIGRAAQSLAVSRSMFQVRGSRDGRVMAVANTIGVFLLPKDPFEWVVLLPGKEVRCVSVSPDGRYVSSLQHTGDGDLWDVRTGRVLRRSHFHTLFSPDGRYFLAGDEDAWIARIWEVEGWKPGPEMISPSYTCQPAFSPDGTLLAIDNGDAIRLLETATGHEVAALDGPDQEVSGMITFTPDGGKLVSTSNGNPPSVHVWDLGEIRRQLDDLGLDWKGPTLPREAHPSWKATLRLEIDEPEAATNAMFRFRRDRDRARARLALDSSDGEAHLSLGRALNLLGEPAEAFTHLATARRLLPGRVEVFQQRVLVGSCLGRWSDVLADVDEGLRLTPDSARLRAYRGRALQKLGRHEEAVADFTTALARSPREGEVYQWRAESQSALGRRAEAEADDRKAEKLQSPIQLNNLAWSLANGLLGERDPARALTLIRLAVAKAPDEPVLLNTLGVALYRNALYPQAIPILERHLTASKGESDAFDLFFLAMSRARLGEVARARADFDLAVQWRREHPNQPPQWTTELDAFQAEARALLDSPLPELPADVFAPTSSL